MISVTVDLMTTTKTVLVLALMAVALVATAAFFVATNPAFGRDPAPDIEQAAASEDPWEQPFQPSTPESEARALEAFRENPRHGGFADRSDEEVLAWMRRSCALVEAGTDRDELEEMYWEAQAEDLVLTQLIATARRYACPGVSP